MPVSPQDFELYSRMTGAPMPTDAMSRMQMAPDVYNFTKNFARKPNLFEKTGNLVKNIGRGAVMALGAPLVAASEAENARMQEQLRNQADKAESESVTMSEPMTAAERTVAARKELSILGHNQKMKEKAFDRETAQIKMGITQQPTTAGNYGQNVVINSTAQNVIDKKMEQGSQMADSVPNIAEVLSESEESQPASLYGTNPLNVPRLMSEDVGTTASPEFIAKFRKKRNLDKALKGVFKLGQQEEELVDDSTIVQSSSPLNDHPDVKDVSGGEEPNPRMGTNTSPTKNLGNYYKEMRKMDAQERIKNISPSNKQVNLLEKRAIDNEAAISSGFMRLDDEGRKKESIRLGSTGGIPNKTDMEEIRKDPEYIAAQNSMKPSTLERAENFIAISPAATVVTPEKSSFVKSVSLNPPSGDNPNMISFDLGNPEKRSQFIMSDPMAVSMGEMAADGSLANESLGKIFNMALDDVDENRKARKAGQKYRGLFRPVDGQ